MEAIIESREVREKLNRLRTRLPAAMKRVLERTGSTHTRAMAQRFVPYSGRTAGFNTDIQMRSGALRRSFSFHVSPGGDELRLVAGGLRYIRMQEYGGTIVPKTRKYLTVPLPAALTPSGVLKGGARLVTRTFAGPRGGDVHTTADGRPTVIFHGRSGTLIVAAKQGKRIVPLYALVKSVRLRGRLGFAKTFSERTEPFALRETAAALEALTA